MSQDHIAFLKQARSLIEDPEHHLQNVFATNADGMKVGYGSTEAVNFCLLGAFDRTAYLSTGDWSWSTYDAVYRRVQTLTLDLYDQTLIVFNDNNPHEDVMDILDAVLEGYEMEAENDDV